MSQDPLDREYGVLLGVVGPVLLERAKNYRRLARMVNGKAKMFYEVQAQRAEEAIRVLGEKFNGSR